MSDFFGIAPARFSALHAGKTGIAFEEMKRVIALSSPSSHIQTTGGKEVQMGIGGAGPGGLFAVESGLSLVGSGTICNLPDLRQRWGVETEDTGQILLAGFQKEGADFVHALKGHFSLALHDGRPPRERLFLFRDPVGEGAPLYYTLRKEGLFFSSNLGSLSAVFPVSPVAEAKASPYFERQTLYQHVSRIQPGERMEFNIAAQFPRLNRYSDVRRTDSLETNLDTFGQILKAGIAERTPPRPFGLLWGGDVDSTLLTLAMRPNAIFACAVSGMEDAEERASAAARRIGASFVRLTPEHERGGSRVSVSSAPAPDLSALPEYRACQIAALCGLKGMVSSAGADLLLLGEVRHAFFLSLELFSPSPTGNLPIFLCNEYRNADPHARYHALIRAGASRFALGPFVQDTFERASDTGQAISLTDLAIFLPPRMAVCRAVESHTGLAISHPFLAPDVVRASLALPLGLKFNEAARRGKDVLFRLLVRLLEKWDDIGASDILGSDGESPYFYGRPSSRDRQLSLCG